MLTTDLTSAYSSAAQGHANAQHNPPVGDVVLGKVEQCHRCGRVRPMSKVEMHSCRERPQRKRDDGTNLCDLQDAQRRAASRPKASPYDACRAKDS